MDEQERAVANAAQVASPSYRLASQDTDFLLGESMRGVRFLLEFAKVDEALKAWGVRSTIVAPSWRVSPTSRCTASARSARVKAPLFKFNPRSTA